jgi:3',5'-cyclic AMP phosphodiesterase CpdA
MSAEIRFAHLSDWHATSLEGAGRGLLNLKRLSGWASWRFSRRYRHSLEILEAAFRDVHSRSVDRILVSGDLTHVSLQSEFITAAEQLAALGTSEHVFLIPGNHDCYVPVEPAQSWDHWADYLRGTDPSELDAAIAECLVSQVETSESGRAPRHEDYPTLRIRGRMAVVGLCSAIPLPIFRAGGLLGAAQLDRLERLLATLREQGYARIVMLHHPVIATDESARRALRDAEALREILERQGADLVLHGHKHRRRVHRLTGPGGEIPIVGIPSSSEVGSRPGKRAQYHIYTLKDDAGGAGFSIEVEIRGYDPESGEFAHVDESLFSGVWS